MRAWERPCRSASGRRIGVVKQVDAYHNVYGATFRRVMRMVPLFLRSVSAVSSASSSSGPSSSGSRFRLRDLFTTGIGPFVRKGAAERRNPSSNSWLERMLRSWSAMPFPILSGILSMDGRKMRAKACTDLREENSTQYGQTCVPSVRKLFRVLWRRRGIAQ